MLQSRHQSGKHDEKVKLPYLQRMSRKDLSELKSSRKWASSHTLNIGLLIETQKASSSNISYPKLKKLPPLLNSLSVSLIKDDKIHTIGSEIDSFNSIQKECKRLQKRQDLDNQLKNMESLVKNQPDLVKISNSYDASFNVPKDVAFLSPTIRHIYEASQNRSIFKESNGHITLLASDLGLKEIICHLYSQWIKQNLELDSNCNPGKDNVLEVLELGLYLGLQELVEICCEIISRNIKYIANLDGLPDPVAYKIFTLMDLRDLIDWELRKTSNAHADMIRLAYVYHFGLNIGSMFRYIKDISFQSTSNYLAFCRNSCTCWFLESNILKLNMSDISYQKILENFGQNIFSLDLIVDDDQVSPNKYFLRNIAKYLKNLKDLKITFLHFNPVWISISEYLMTKNIESLVLTFGYECMCHDLDLRLLSRFLKAFFLQRFPKQKQTKYIMRNISPMDVSGINHFTSEDKSINEILKESSISSVLDAELNVYTLNEDIVCYFERQNACLSIENITCLDFSNLRLGSKGIIILVQELQNFKNLVSLNVFNTDLSEDGICYLMKHLPLLQKLNIGNNVKNSSSLESLESSKLIAKYIMRSESHLQDLNLSGNKFSFMGMRQIYESIQKFQNHSSVNLSNMEIKTSISYLSKMEFKNLNISDNAIISRSLIEFLSSLNTDGLESLDISHNFMDNLTLECLGKKITNGDFHNLKILKLSNRSDAIKISNGDFQNLLGSFIRNPCNRLEQIDLSNHDIGDQLCEYLSQVIQKNKRLYIINLENNRITIDGMKYFSGLDKLRRMIQVNLKKNYIYGNLQKYSLSNKWRHYFCFDNQHY